MKGGNYTMAKKEKATPKAEATATGMITIKMLCEEYNVEAKDLRALIRKEGFKAPEIPRAKGEFGPRAKYEWPADSDDPKKIRKAVEKVLAEADAAAEEE